MHWQILHAKAFVEVGDSFGNGIDDVGYFVSDDKLDILVEASDTLAASWSPRKRPSLILMGPKRNYMVACAFLKSGWLFRINKNINLNQRAVINHITRPARIARWTACNEPAGLGPPTVSPSPKK